MATVYDRIVALKVQPTLEQKIAIGREVAQEYFKIPIEKRKPIYRVKIVEPEGEFCVLSYPKRFLNVIDKIILKNVSVTVKKRQRIKFQKVVHGKK